MTLIDAPPNAPTGTPEQLKTFYAAIVERFNGVGKTKNLFGIDEEARAGRFNLVSLMTTVVMEPGMTYTELGQLPEVQAAWAKHAAAPQGEPPGRWKLLCQQAREYLESSVLASKWSSRPAAPPPRVCQPFRRVQWPD